MKKLFFYIICIMLQLLSCNHLFASVDTRGLEGIKRLKQNWEDLKGYVSLDPQRLPYVLPIMEAGMQALDPQRLPYVLPIAAAGMQTLALPGLAKRGYVSPEVAQMASFATGIAAPAAANWLQYQHNKAQPKLTNFNYFTPSAIMAALNWIASGRNIRDLPHIVLQYLYTLPVSVFASVREGESALENLKDLTDPYSQAKNTYERQLTTLSEMTDTLINNPTSQLDLKQVYINAIKTYNALVKQLQEIGNISSDSFEPLEAPWMILLKPIVGKLVLENTADRQWMDDAINQRDISSMLTIIYRSIRDKQEEIKSILQRGNISELDYLNLNHSILLLLNAGQQAGWPHYVVRDQIALFVQNVMTYINNNLEGQ